MPSSRAMTGLLVPLSLSLLAQAAASSLSLLGVGRGAGTSRDLSVSVDTSDQYQTRLHGTSLLVDLQLMEVRSMGGVIRLAPSHLELDFNGTRWTMVVDKDRSTFFHREAAVMQLISPDFDERHVYQLSLAGDLALRDLLLDHSALHKPRSDLCAAGSSSVCGSGAVSLVNLLTSLTEVVLAGGGQAVSKQTEMAPSKLLSFERKLEQEAAKIAALNSKVADLQSKMNEKPQDRDKNSPLNRKLSMMQQTDTSTIKAEFSAEMRTLEDQMTQAESKLKAQLVLVEGKLSKIQSEVVSLLQRLLDYDTQMEVQEARLNSSSAIGLEKVTVAVGNLKKQVADCGELRSDFDLMQDKLKLLDRNLRSIREQSESSDSRESRSRCGDDGILLGRLSAIELSVNSSAERVINEGRQLRVELISELRQRAENVELAELRRMVEWQARRIETLEASKTDCVTRTELAELRALVLRQV